MADDTPETDSPAEAETSFAQSAKEARRAQWSLNLLVMLSAVAGAVFFGYVLFQIQPFGTKTAEPINVPTSSVGEKFGVLASQADGPGLEVTFRDIDEAPGYREKLSDVMREDLGISAPGRLYLLVVRNFGKEAVGVDGGALKLKADGKEWQAQWLDEVAKPASATGRMRLAQSGRKFELATGDERQIYVFIPSAGDAPPPSGEKFASGEVSLSDTLKVSLTHTEIKAIEQ